MIFQISLLAVTIANAVVCPIKFQAGAIYLMDRSYLVFRRLFRMHQSGALFVTRAKKRFDCQRLYSQAVDKQTGLQRDQVVTLNNPVPKRGYPERLRRARYYDGGEPKAFCVSHQQFPLARFDYQQSV